MVKPLRLADERGQILIVAAVGGLVLMIGITALAIDGSLMYDRRNELHAAADAAAKVGAIELRRNSALTTTELKRFADEQVNALGLTAAACGATSGTSVCINHPPLNPASPFNCTNSPPPTCNFFVEAIVTQQTPTFFARLLGRTIMTPGARAVAGVSPGPNCMVIFDHVNITNPAAGSVVDMGGCSLVINGKDNPPADLDNRGTITAGTIGVVHTGAAGCVNACTPPNASVTYGVAPATDPLLTLPAMAAPVGAPACGAGSQYDITVATVIDDIPADYPKYMCGFNFNGGTLAMNPGNYYVNGPITAQNPGTDSTISATGGSGVFIFLTAANGRVNIVSNHLSITLDAPTTAPYNGILFYQDRTTPNYAAVFGKNTTDLAIRGAFYFPTATIQMKNENSATLTNPCMVIVAYAIEVDKPNFQLNNSCLGYLGSPLMSLTVVE